MPPPTRTAVPPGERVESRALRALAETDPWANKLVRFLDELVPIPGTNKKLGLDGIIGFFIPGAGDALTGVGSISLLFLALKHRVPTLALGRMVMNILVDMVVGAVPFAGDLFDVFFKSNRRNLDLIEKYRTDPKAKATASDYVLVGVGVLIAIGSVLVPLLVWLTIGAGLVTGLRELFGGGAPVTPLPTPPLPPPTP